MSRLDSLPPDLHAVLSLLLRQRKRYAEVARLLGIAEHAVHDRAHAALALLAPRQARELSPSQREQLGEYLLGQQAPTAERETRVYLEQSPAGRAWAEALAVELAPLAARALPHVPAEGPPAAAPSQPRRDIPAAAQEPSPATPAAAAPSSRVGGAVILGGLAAIVVVIVLLIVGVGGAGGGSHASSQPSASSTAPGGSSQPSSGTGASTGTTTGSGGATTTPAAGTTKSGSPTSHGKALTLTPPDPATSKAVGVAYVLSQKNQRAFYVFAKGLPVLPTGTFYAVWLEGASGAPAYPLGSLPAQGSDGLVEGGGPLPTNAASYHRILVTDETSHHPAHPGTTVLGGTFSVD